MRSACSRSCSSPSRGSGRLAWTASPGRINPSACYTRWSGRAAIFLAIGRLMQLNLRQIQGTRALEHIERHYEAAALQSPDDLYTIAAPVDLTFDLEKDRDKYHLVGRVTTRLE